jgi:streptomycin 6-kinase
MPRDLVDAARREGRESWLERLPATVRDLAARWTLTVREPFQPGGQTAWVAPAVGTRGMPVVLKVMWRHAEAAHEADALREWDGDGAVRLHAVAELDDTIALLLERCVPGTTLKTRPEPEQDEVVTGLLRRLWRAPSVGHRFRSLQVMCDAWADEFERKADGATLALDIGIVRAGVDLFRALPRSAHASVLLSTDLHAGNVVAAQREPWLAIDPKPYVGDPTYDALQHLLNCNGRLRADPRSLVQRIAGLLDLDAERLLLWLFARCVVEAADWPALARVAERIRPV